LFCYILLCLTGLSCIVPIGLILWLILAFYLDGRMRKRCADRSKVYSALNDGWIFLFLWVLATLVSFAVLEDALTDFMLDLPDKFGNRSVDAPVLRIIVGLLYLLGFTHGVPRGAMQWLVLRRNVSCIGWWVLLSAMGQAVVQAGIAGVILTMAVVPDDVLLDVVIFTGISAGQWLVLRRKVPRAGWWIFANAAGWVVGYFGQALTQEAWWLSRVEPKVIPGIVAGIITGMVLIWLLRQPMKIAPREGGALCKLD
jgi:hypothetical protein